MTFAPVLLFGVTSRRVNVCSLLSVRPEQGSITLHYTCVKPLRHAITSQFHNSNALVRKLLMLHSLVSALLVTSTIRPVEGAVAIGGSHNYMLLWVRLVETYKTLSPSSAQTALRVQPHGLHHGAGRRNGHHRDHQHPGHPAGEHPSACSCGDGLP